MLNKNNLRQNFENFLTKKIFSEVYYNKYYIRSNFLDTSNNLYNFKKNVIQGVSFYKNTYSYSHIYNNKFTFNSFLNKRNLHSKLFLKNFYNSLSVLKKKKLFFILLKPVKGGFLSYFSGLIGFIPKNNVLVLIKKLFSKIKTVLFFVLLYSFIKVSKLLKCLRLSIKAIKIKINYFHRKRNFSSIKNFRFRRLSFKSTFLLKKFYKLPNENKKSKKKYKTRIIQF